MASEPIIVTGGLDTNGVRRWSIWLAVALLLVVYANSFVDRQIISLLVMPIRADLRISDTQFSLLNGLAFALFYATLGIPIARWVDRGDRGGILGIGTLTWSVFTMLCGWAGSFGTLFLARMGVGAGEATLVPCIYSLLADYFPPHRRGLAMGVFGSGVYLGMGLALIVGGTLLQFFGKLGDVALGFLGSFSAWQLIFLLVGAPGLVLAALVALIWEPRRRSRGGFVPTAKATVDAAGPSAKSRDTRAVGYGLLSTWRGARASICAHHLASGFLAMALYGVVSWAPEYLRRTFGIETAQGGYQIGVVLILLGTAGVIAGGVISDQLLRHGVASARLIVLASAGALASPALIYFNFALSPHAALTCIGCATFFLAMLTSCGPLGVQELYPSQCRAQGAAVFQLLVTLMGLGAGPAAIALTSDHLTHHAQPLATALGIVTPLCAFVAAGVAVVGISSYGKAVRRAAEMELNARATPSDCPP